MHSRRLFALVVVLGCAGLFTAASPAAAASPPRAPTLFVLRGPARVAQSDLSVRTRSVEWFTDRPERHAGTMPPRTIVQNWQAWGFADDPPNAALTGHKVDVVVELSSPRVRNGQIHFHVKPVRGRLPHGSLGAVSAFVDATSSQSASTVRIVNNSGAATTAFVFVTPDYSWAPLQSLSWLTAQLYPGASSSLSWDSSTQLMAGLSGAVVPGVVFDERAVVSMAPAGQGQSGVADLAEVNGNLVLTADAAGGTQPGSLAVEIGGSVGFNQAAVAVGLSGSPALIASASPDVTTTFPVNGLTYWLATSNFIEPGQVIDQYATQGAVQLRFPPGVSSLTATLNADGTWTVA